MDDKTEPFVSRELYFSAVLYSLQIKLLDVKKEDSTCWFYFENKQRCEEIRRKFIAKELQIDAKSYEESIRSLKDIVFERRA